MLVPIAWSFLARFVFMQLITFIEFKNHSRYMNAVVVAVFIIFFFNYGV